MVLKGFLKAECHRVSQPAEEHEILLKSEQEDRRTAVWESSAQTDCQSQKSLMSHLSSDTL